MYVSPRRWTRRSLYQATGAPIAPANQQDATGWISNTTGGDAGQFQDPQDRLELLPRPDHLEEATVLLWDWDDTK